MIVFVVVGVVGVAVVVVVGSVSDSFGAEVE